MDPEREQSLITDVEVLKNNYSRLEKTVEDGFKEAREMLIEERRRTNGSLDKIAKNIENIYDKIEDMKNDITNKFEALKNEVIEIKLNQVKKDVETENIQKDVSKNEDSLKEHAQYSWKDSLPINILLIVLSSLITWFISTKF
ncbi:hypothetical protein [Thermosipho sp. (in: thermotogales)]|jgi:septal ring factor EnvC (AmiA/AmiB activator)|uniref:hypothetical protein n=1 Tax=Thermosipho sp. (in: thermotogales) TaxID=1968895 RepID=UPI002579CFB4|nr:hypothetical protein [Thermosipho sp. (in: thermotogales)]MBZ4649161.1 hypothetical protein [Thermosipho sp. (in: thermotogales)]